MSRTRLMYLYPSFASPVLCMASTVALMMVSSNEHPVSYHEFHPENRKGGE